MIYPIVSYRAIPKAHTYLPCRLDTEDSIHHLQKEASAVLHPAAKTDLSADWRHLRPLAATRNAIWQPKQVKQNSEGGKAWWEANPGGKVVKSEQFGGFVTAITFTGFSSERDGPLKFWTVDADWHMLLARKLHYPRRSGCVSRIDQRTKLGVVPVG